MFEKHRLQNYYMNLWRDPTSHSQVKILIILAPTGMVAYSINGNPVHSTLHIDIGKSKLTPLSHSELNTLRLQCSSLKSIFCEELSMIEKIIFNKNNQRLQQMMGINKPFGGLHVFAVGGFYQMASVKDYGSLTITCGQIVIYIFFD